MCEVEFWEVLDRMCKGFLDGTFSSPSVDCRIADLAGYSDCFLLLFVKGLRPYSRHIVGTCLGDRNAGPALTYTDDMSRQYWPTRTADTSLSMPA
jgi:hypothetical protein